MDQPTRIIATLAQDLVRIDSRSSVSNRPLADRLLRELEGFEIEQLPFLDEDGVDKVALVATRGVGGIAFSAHMDTVPDTGWANNPWSGLIEGDTLHGLGSTDMKGQLAALVVAARTLPPRLPVALFITTDEETTKAGAAVIVESRLARLFAPKGILIAGPTRMAPVRGHRSHIDFTATAIGLQAHSSSGRGRNANWDLIPFLTEMRRIHDRLRLDETFHDPAYDPVYSDFNPIIDNHGTAVNVTVPKATVRIKFRYSAGIDPTPIVDAVRLAAESTGLRLTERWEGSPPELSVDHPLVTAAVAFTGQPARTVPFGTDACQLQALAPCIVMGPGDIATAHTPRECVSLTALTAAVPIFQQMARQFG